VDAGSSHLARLGAASRPAGSRAADEARTYCAGVLRALGFSVTEHSFEYSKFAGAFAAPLAGVCVAAFAITIYVMRPHSAMTLAGVGVAAGVAAVAFRLVGSRGVLELPFARAGGVNLEAVRGAAEPNVWLVAHIDSKWQPVSMSVRVAGVVLSVIGLAGLVATASSMRPAMNSLATTFLVLAVLGSVPLLLSFVGARNHGTLDNASGVATVLAAAALLGTEASVGILITDAEELALAGARAWGRAKRPGIALNCDSVDDEGSLVIMHNAPAPDRIVAAMSGVARESGEALRVMRLIPGILTDHVALASAGWQTLTLSRGTARTLRRIHTSRDTLATMRGAGIAGAARVLARTAAELS
jgi:hypothetical protein